MEPPQVQELLKMCPPEDEAWDIYAKGCTLGINQCEQNGTAQRVAKYKPKNISELGAFVAAIRPGFKSMYKKFEERTPFTYGVKAFDNLIQTDEMPNSFLLYQEQEMAALNYAGLAMDECYAAIKNIAKKRAEKVLAYKEAFISGFAKSIVEDTGCVEVEADELSQELWQIIEDSARYSFNASHSYCVALDSLYCAWLKAHHPLEFYEVLLAIAEEKGDKDKMNALKEEAENYFDIKFPPFRFRQDNRKTHADLESNSIVNSISAIKGFGVGVGRLLYECGQTCATDFTDVLKWLDKHAIKAAKVKPLIMIDYFQEFGDILTLLDILDVWELFKQGDAKLIKKDKVTNSLLRAILDKNCSSKNKDNTDSTSYKLEGKTIQCLKEYEVALKSHPIPPLPLKTRIAYSIDVLGYVDIATGKPEDKRRLLISDVTPLGLDKSIWGYRVSTRSVGSGKTARLTIRKAVFDNNPIESGDIVFANQVYKNATGYWYLMDYRKEW